MGWRREAAGQLPQHVPVSKAALPSPRREQGKRQQRGIRASGRGDFAGLGWAITPGLWILAEKHLGGEGPVSSPGAEGRRRELKVCRLHTPSSGIAEMPPNSRCDGDRDTYRGNVVPHGCWMGGRGGRIAACFFYQSIKKKTKHQPLIFFLFHSKAAHHCSKMQLLFPQVIMSGKQSGLEACWWVASKSSSPGRMDWNKLDLWEAWASPAMSVVCRGRLQLSGDLC